MGDLLRLPNLPDRAGSADPARPEEPARPKLPRRPDPAPVEPLWRELVGDQLRRRRHEREETLGEVADRAGISTQYLSEVERGLKDPSSELLSAVAGALDLTILDLSVGVARRLGSGGHRASAPRGPLALAS